VRTAITGPLATHALRQDPLTVEAAQSIAIGDRTLLALSDGFFSMEQHREFLGSPREPTGGYDVLREVHGAARLPVGCFVLLGDPTVLIDAGTGPVDVMGLGILLGGNLLNQLARHRLRPEDIDVVALSHLHLDHIGWLATTEAEPVFPNATIYLGRPDWDYFVDTDDAERSLPAYLHAALTALAEQDRVRLLDDDRQIAPGVTRLAAPGHTPGHSLYAIHDHDDRALLFGDAMYCPQQLTNSDWAAASDVDANLARRTRERYLRDLEAHGGAAVGCHFPELRAGRMLSGGWQPR